MKTIIIITADHNDGDYVYSIHEEKYLKPINEVIDFLKKIASVLNKGSYNWCTNQRAEDEENPEKLYKGILTGDEIESFNQLVPYVEYGIHTIESIRILKVEEDLELI